MSISPPLRRLSSTSSSSKESLINAYEAEEERIINVLSRKLEKLREEKIELENALEAESEATVNRLSRELSALRLAQQQNNNQAQLGPNGHAATNGSGAVSPVGVRGPLFPVEPTPEMMLEAMRRENEQLRTRLVETERDYIRVTRLNEIYRQELIEHRGRLGLSVDDLIGLSPSQDPLSQPIHLLSQSNASSLSASPRSSVLQPAIQPSSARVAIPRPPSQIRRPIVQRSRSTTPPSSSSASFSSPLFSPPTNAASVSTNITTPGSGPAIVFGANGNPHELTYPSVPPPSLSSSFGDPSLIEDADTHPLPAPVPIPRPIPRRDLDFSGSPIDTFGSGGRGGGIPSSPLSPRRSFTLNRRGSFDRSGSNSHMILGESPGGRTGGGWVDGFESLDGSRTNVNGIRSRSGHGSRSVERGVRVAETGQLVPRSRRQSVVEPVANEVRDTVSQTANGSAQQVNRQESDT